MGLSAIGSLADSIDATRDFLFSPIRPRRWLALALVVFFAGTLGGGFNPTSFANARDTGTQQQASEDVPSMAEGFEMLQTFVAEHLTWILVLGSIFIVVSLFFWLLGIAMQFVFVESLRQESVDVWGYLSDSLGKALHVAGLEAAIWIAMLVPWLAVGYVAWDPLFAGEALPRDTLLPLVALAGIVSVVGTLVQSFTRRFVVPVMLTADVGVLAGWRRFLSAASGSLVEYVVYFVVATVLTIALGTVAAVLVGIAAMIVFVPLVFVGFVLWAIGGFSTGVLVALGVLGILVGVLLVAVGAIVQVPFAAYIQYYALFVLGDTDRLVDPIPETRSRVRSDPMPDADPTV